MVQQVNWILKTVFNFSASLWGVDAPEAVDLPSVFRLNKCQSWVLTDAFIFTWFCLVAALLTCGILQKMFKSWIIWEADTHMKVVPSYVCMCPAKPQRAGWSVATALRFWNLPWDPLGSCAVLSLFMAFYPSLSFKRLLCAVGVFNIYWLHFMKHHSSCRDSSAEFSVVSFKSDFRISLPLILKIWASNNQEQIFNPPRFEACNK